MTTVVGEVAAEVPSMDVLGQWMRVAARAGDAAYIQSLIDYGVPVDLEDPNGFTSLMWGAYYGRTEVVSVLLDNDADPNHQNFANDTSLMWACLGGFYDIVVDLVEHEADPNMQEKEGWTALMGAAVQGHYDVVEYLLDVGADKHIENILGHSAIILASAMDRTNVVPLLGDAEYINDQDDKQMTSLHHAAASNYTYTVEAILEFCPNYTLLDENNMTALERAEDIGFTKGVILIEAYIHAQCSRFGMPYAVGDVVYQNCEELECHCNGRWKLTGERNENCGQNNTNQILTNQRVKRNPETSNC